MADYPKMYQELFRAVTKAIELLQEAQIKTEEIFITLEEAEEACKIQDKKEDSTPK